MDKKKTNLTLILILMVITGFIIYFMYLKPESFTTTEPATTLAPATTKSPTTTYNACASQATPIVPAAIVSRYFGVGFNIYSVNNPVLSSSSLTNVFLIEHIPITSTGTAGGMYAITSDGSFTIKIKNFDDSTQWWNMLTLTDSTNNTKYYVMQSFVNNSVALQYENGNLSARPFTSPGFEAQKWLTSTVKITRGIPVLNVSPASMFTTEFDPYSSSYSTLTSTNNLTDANNKQVSDVVNAVKSGIQQYLAQMETTQPTQVSASSLGNKDMPLSVNLNLNGSRLSGVSNFDNVTGSTSNSDILSILDKYEANSSNNNNNSLYTINDLQNQLNTYQGCKLLNVNDYTSNRVSTCNCKL